MMLLKINENYAIQYTQCRNPKKFHNFLKLSPERLNHAIKIFGYSFKFFSFKTSAIASDDKPIKRTPPTLYFL